MQHRRRRPYRAMTGVIIGVVLASIIVAGCASGETKPSDVESVVAERPPSIGPGFGPFVVLDFPEIVLPSEASYLEPDELVLGLALGDDSRSYPVRIAWFHHIFNDELGGTPVLVTY